MKASPFTFRSGNLRSCTVWPLLAAWCCANVPFGLALCILSWTAGARHFDHQEQLKQQVEVLLHRKAPFPSAHRQFASRPNPPVPHPSPDSLAKRLDAIYSPVLGCVIFPSRGRQFRPGDFPRPDWERTEPLVEPPRPLTAG